MKYTDFLPETVKQWNDFLTNDNFSIRDVSLACGPSPNKALIKRLVVAIFGADRPEDEKHKMHRFTGNEMLGISATIMLVQQGLVSAEYAKLFYDSITLGIDPDAEFVKAGSVPLDKAEGVAIALCRRAYPVLNAIADPTFSMVCTPMMDSSVPNWQICSGQLELQGPAIVVNMYEIVNMILARLQDKYDDLPIIPEGKVQVMVNITFTAD